MDTPWQNPAVVAHTQRLVRNFKQWTGRDFWPAADGAGSAPGTTAPEPAPLDLAHQVFHAPFVLVSHGTEADPVLNYGNQTALSLWEMSWEELTRTPSRLTAEAPNREERARLLAAVTARGFIDDYSGIRISKNGRRFRIAQATVWNLLDEHGQYCGQAARFADWKWL